MVETISIFEVGPRDGLQNIKNEIPQNDCVITDNRRTTSPSKDDIVKEEGETEASSQDGSGEEESATEVSSNDDSGEEDSGPEAFSKFGPKDQRTWFEKQVAWSHNSIAL